MGTLRRLLISLCAALFFSTFFTVVGNAQNVLCYENQDYRPYLVGDSATPYKANPGVLVELTQKAFDAVGLEISFIRRPWKRCMRMVKDDKAIGMFGVIYVKERESIGRYPMKNDKPDVERRLLNVDYPIFRHIENGTLPWDGQSFSTYNVRIGTPLGYATVKSLRKKHNIEPNVSYLPDAGLKMVARNKLDGYIVEKNVGNSLLKKFGLEKDVVAHKPPYVSHNLYLLLSHGFYDSHTAEAEKIWSTLATLRATVLDEIMDSYMNDQQ